MEILYYVFEPTGNKTVLVITPVPDEMKPTAIKELLKTENDAEQIGFFTKSGNTVSVLMSGGEFCGNAAMCSAALAAFFDKKSEAGYTVFFEKADVSASASVKKSDDGLYIGEVLMPSPYFVGEAEYSYGGKRYLLPTVRYNGMTHAVVMNNEIDKKSALSAVVKWCRDMDEKALGIMFYDTKSNILDPLVYVDGSETLCFEGSCASGSAAIGEYIYYKNGGTVDLELCEPKGILRVKKEEKSRLKLKGSVLFAALKKIIM